MNKPFEHVDFNRPLKEVFEQITDHELLEAIGDNATKMGLMLLIVGCGEMPPQVLQMEQLVAWEPAFDRLLMAVSMERGGRADIIHWPRSIHDPRPMRIQLRREHEDFSDLDDHLLRGLARLSDNYRARLDSGDIPSSEW